MQTQTPLAPEVGDFLSYTLVTDTVVYEVIKVTPATITVRNTREGEVLRRESNGSPYPVVYSECVSDPTGRTRVLRRRKDGTFRVYHSAGALRQAPRVEGKPVRRVDYSF